MGVFGFPAMDDYWHHESRFSVTADIMPKGRFKLLCRFIHFSDNQQCDGSADRFYKIRPLLEMLRKQCLLIPSTFQHSVALAANILLTSQTSGVLNCSAGPVHLASFMTCFSIRRRPRSSVLPSLSRRRHCLWEPTW